MNKILPIIGRITIIIMVVILVILPFVHPIMYWRLNRFAWANRFLGYDNKPPRYLGRKKINRYLAHLHFKSRIPLREWKSHQPILEVFFNKSIYNITAGKTVRDTEIFLIQESLPAIIPWDDSYIVEGRRFAIGEGYNGKIIWDVKSLPHGLVAGSSGGGKSSLLRSLIHQAIVKRWNVTVMDFKNSGDFHNVEQENSNYHDLEDGYGPFLISDPEEARQFLLGLVVEAKGRLQAFKETGIADIDEYNASGKGHFLPWLVVIDEAAEILDVKPLDKAEKERYIEINQSLRTLARMSRAAGITLLLGFIRPSADILDGQIKNNLLFRCCGFFSDPAASRIVLDNDRATELPPEIKGRFIIGEDESQAYYLPAQS